MIEASDSSGITFNEDGRYHHTVRCSGCNTVLLETHGSIHLPYKEVRVVFTCPNPGCARETVWTDLANGIGPSHNWMMPGPTPDHVPPEWG